MDIIYSFILLILCQLCTCEKPTDEDPSHLIDSLVIPLAPDQNQSAQKPVQIDPDTWPSKSDDSNKPEFYPLANRIKPSDGSKWTGSQDVGEITCPKIYCYVIRDRPSGETRLDCKNDVVSSPDIVTLIDCRFWLTSTSQRDSIFKESDFSQINVNEGRGYDLKLLLRPSSSRRLASGTVALLKVDRLSPGILQWIIRVMRENLNMRFSPIHLSISFMYFGHLSRGDLAILPISARVTRLSLWNPVKWDEDSFIALSNHKSIAPPYFRLTVFCDHENRQSSFQRLWLPWKTWQIRFNHCPTIYSCRRWDNQFPICERNSTATDLGKKSFMPSFLIVARSLDEKALTYPVQYGSGMQILFNNQCNQDPTDLEFVQDMKLDSKNGCWQPGVFVLNPNDSSTSTTTTSTTTTASSSTSSSTEVPTTGTTPVAVGPLDDASMLNTSPIPAANDTMLVPLDVTNSSTDAPILIPAYPDDQLTPESADQTLDQIQTAGSSDSLSRLTYAIILLALFNILLLLCFIFLVLWIRRKIRERRQARQPLGKDSDPSHSDFANYGNHESSFTPLIGPTHYGSHLTGLDVHPSYSMPKLYHPHPGGNGYPNPNFYPNEAYVNTPGSNYYQNGSLHLSLQRKRRRKSLNETGPQQQQPPPRPPLPQRTWRTPSTGTLGVQTEISNGHADLSPHQPWSGSRRSIHKPISTGNLSRPNDLHQLVYPQRGVSHSSISKSIELLSRLDPIMTTSVPPRSPSKRDRSASPRPKIKATGRKSVKKPHTLVFENGDLSQSPFVSETLRKSLSQLH